MNQQKTASTPRSKVCEVALVRLSPHLHANHRLQKGRFMQEPQGLPRLYVVRRMAIVDRSARQTARAGPEPFMSYLFPLSPSLFCTHLRCPFFTISILWGENGMSGWPSHLPGKQAQRSLLRILFVALQATPCFVLNTSASYPCRRHTLVSLAG